MERVDVMERETVRELLFQLRDTIQAEREHAKALDLPAMMADVRHKEALLNVLNSVERLHPDDQQYAREIQQENRRNAFQSFNKKIPEDLDHRNGRREKYGNADTDDKSHRNLLDKGYLGQDILDRTKHDNTPPPLK